MKLKVGDVVNKRNGLFIVTDTTSNGDIKFEEFKDFINKNYAIEFEGEQRTLHEINEMLTEQYLRNSNRVIIETGKETVENELKEIIAHLKEIENDKDLHGLDSSRISEAIQQLEFLV